MSFSVEIGVFFCFFLFYAVVCWTVLVLESSQDGISTLTYFSQNSEKTRNFFL